VEKNNEKTHCAFEVVTSTQHLISPRTERLATPATIVSCNADIFATQNL
jgi:hypothetical protein